MTGIALRPRLISAAFWVITFIADPIFGQGQAGRYDVLRGSDNESSCQLKDTIHLTCNPTIAAPALNVTPATSLCTCNKVFFNIWSACSYASGNNTLPVFSIWTSTCTNNSVDLTKSTSLSTLKGGLGIVIPPWAVPDVPGNTTFDLQKAVVLVRPQRWSTLQIVTPLITAILGIILTLISTAICRRSKLGKVKLREEFSHRLRRPRKVKSVQYLGAEWEIEPHEPEDHGQATTTKVDEPFVFVDAPPSSVGQDTIPAHPSRYSESSGDITAVARHGGSGSAMIPGNPEQRTAVDHPGVDGEYPFGPSHQIQSRTPLIPVRHLPGTSIKHPTSTDSELGMNRGWRFPGPSSFKAIHIPRPWKRGPGKLVEIQPTKGFRVDPRTSASVIGHSTEGSESTRDSPASSYPRRSFDIADNLDESDSLDHRDNVHNGDGDVGSDDEDTNLISHEEREERRRSDDVVTTRSPGARSSGMDTVNTSSTNPNITIISPTVSASSPRSTRIVGPSPSKTNTAAVPVIPPIIPPRPNQPAPVVPANIFKRVLPRRRDNNPEPSITQEQPLPPDRLTMTPIQEARSEEGMTTIGSSPSPMPVQSNSNDQQAPTGPSRSVPKRTPSDELQRASPSPAPSMSGQPLPQFLRAHQRAPSPSPSLYENLTNASPIVKPKAGPSRLLPFEPVSPPTYPRHLHQRSASVASVISVSREHHDDDIYGDPVLPKAPIRRGLSDDGDAASLNLTPDTLSSVPPRNGSPRPQVGRLGENYGALFPASVRGAGYRGIPNG